MMMNNEEKNTNLNQNGIIEQNEINEKKMKSGKMKGNWLLIKIDDSEADARRNPTNTQNNIFPEFFGK